MGQKVNTVADLVYLLMVLDIGGHHFCRQGIVHCRILKSSDTSTGARCTGGVSLRGDGPCDECPLVMWWHEQSQCILNYS